MPGQAYLPERVMLLFVIVALFAVAVCVIISGVRLPRSAIPTKLGWMSEQWLAEYRASHAS